MSEIARIIPTIDFNSGLLPVGIRVVVLPDEIEEKSKGGLILPDIVKDKERAAQVKATLVSMGANAFDGIEGRRPEVGDRVYVGKYAGIRQVGREGKYQIVNDEDIIAIIIEEY